MTKHHLQKIKKGFSLIETILSLLILSGSLAILVKTFQFVLTAILESIPLILNFS